MTSKMTELLGYGLTATIVADKILITGNTFKNKDRLRECGGKWDAEEKAWVFPRTFDLTPLREPPSLHTIPSIIPWVCCRAATSIDVREKTYVCRTHCPAGKKPVWCCSHETARIISTKRKMYSCTECPTPDPRHHIFINGSLHTGD
jgi:hypothetical protein